MRLLSFIFCLFASTVFAQSLDPAKLSSAYREQRNLAYDGVAQCAVSVSQLQDKVAELERKLAEAEKGKEEHGQ